MSTAIAFYPGMTDAAGLQAEAVPVCAMCDKPAIQDCMLCHEFKYCGDECQQTHWVQHERDCNTMHTTAQPGNVAVLLPFDLADDNGNPVSVNHSITYTDATRGQAITEYFSTPIGDLYAEDIGRRGGWISMLRQKRQERRALQGVPSLSRTPLSKQGPNEGVGIGRRPNENELNGTAQLLVEYWPSYSDKAERNPRRWTLSVAVKGHCIYRDAPEEQIQKIMEIRDVTDTRPGLVIWFNVDAFEQAAEMVLPTTGGYLEFTFNTPGDTDVVKTQAVYPNLRYLRSGFTKALKRSGFGSGLTAREQLTRKGLKPDADYILSFHDKRSGKGVRAQLTVRVEDTVDMKVIDIEMYVPDGAATQQDSMYGERDVNAEFPAAIQHEITCDIANQEEVDGLVIALRAEVAAIAEMMETESGDTKLAVSLEKDMDRVQRWLEVLAPHSMRLQAGYPAMRFGEDMGHLLSAINESTQYLLVDGKFARGFKRKVRQARRMQYVKKMRSDGIGWAERKAARWKDMPSRLSNLREAVATYQSKYLDKTGDDYARAQKLIDQLPVLNE